ncbi:MAG: hypothetical protein KBD78_04530 [Oligoflexales bacterium]|nr:hypothetical protein [Oligoflexales bacterium]
MAGINIVPNPGVLSAALALFLLNVYLVKIYFVIPFLKLKDLRDSATSGSEKESAEMAIATSEIESTIKKKKDATLADVKTLSQKVVDTAIQKQNQIILDAQKFAQNEVEALRKDIKKSFEAEIKKLPEISQKLSAQFYDAIVKN